MPTSQVLTTPAIAALFVRSDSHYFDLGVDCYDQKRNALTWQGGTPGIFHPPCRSWGQLSHFAKPAPGERELAIWSMSMVRKFGGVLEHPYSSKLWSESNCLSHGLRDDFGGLLIPVFQSWFSHKAPKKSCLYVVGAVPELPDYLEPVTTQSIQNMNVKQRETTPLPFATWLISLAQSCKVN